VLAVVVAGLVIGHSRSSWATGASRLQTDAVWRLVDFLLEGFVFLLIGEQLPAVIQGLGRYDAGTIAAATAVTLVGVLVVRPLWLLLTQSLPRWMHSRLGGQDDAADVTSRRGERLTGREVAILSWAGTRGVISLAAIFTLPALFPQRDLLLFCTFVAVLVTLVGQGVTFAPLVRALGVRADRADQARLRNQARLAAVEAALARLDQLQTDRPGDVEEQVIGSLRAQLDGRRSRYRRRIDLLSTAEPGELPLSPRYEAAIGVRRQVLEAEREELLRWRDAGRLPDEGLRILERELDHEEGLLPPHRSP
jgi:CPA1 family monovalent cation:H+ antiporter